MNIQELDKEARALAMTMAGGTPEYALGLLLLAELRRLNPPAKQPPKPPRK